MRLGIVSAQKHCKTHLKALRNDGYEVECLGARPSKIEESYDAIVVRVASSSHRGVDVARAWAKQTGRLAIYEDGLSGIRRELKLHAPSENKEAPMPTTCASEVREALTQCAEAFCEARPDDGPEDLGKALRGVLYNSYPDSVGPCSSLIPGIVANIFPTEPCEVPETPEVAPMPESTSIPAFVGGVVPTNKGSTKAYGQDRIRRSYDLAAEIITASNHRTISSFKTALKRGEFSSKVKRRWFNLISGDPLTYAFVALILVPRLSKKQLCDNYREITERGADTRLSDVVEWALGKTNYTLFQAAGSAVAESSADTKAASAAPVAKPPTVGLDPIVDSNTQAILEVLEEVERLTAKVKALEDFRNTQGPVGSEWEARIEGQIKALESGQAETLRQAQTGARQAVSDMRDAVRLDLTEAFDRLAEDPGSTSASDPFSAIEQVKSMLKAAGFTGTLTLTIE